MAAIPYTPKKSAEGRPKSRHSKPASEQDSNETKGISGKVHSSGWGGGTKDTRQKALVLKPVKELEKVLTRGYNAHQSLEKRDMKTSSY